MNLSIRSIRKILFAAAIGCIVATSGGDLRAAQPPMSTAEIDSQSDAVIVADVLGVACRDQIGSVTFYDYWVRIVEVKKGDLAHEQTMLLEGAKIGPRAGGIEVIMYAGQRVRLDLTDDGGGKFRIWHQDGKRTLIDVPANERVMPKKPGDVVLAKSLKRRA